MRLFHSKNQLWRKLCVGSLLVAHNRITIHVHSFPLHVRRSRTYSYTSRFIPTKTTIRHTNPSLSLIQSAATDSNPSHSSTLPDETTHLDPQYVQELLDTAIAAARAAGPILLAHLGCSNQVETTQVDSSSSTVVKWNIKDVVTAHDQQAQAAIESVIRSKYPNHAFLGEESVGAGPEASEQALQTAISKLQRNNNQDNKNDKDNIKVDCNDSSNPSSFLWICDPIDGTANFASGLPLCGVTIAVVYQTTPLVGVIYDPHRDEVFAAVRHQGATLNGRAIYVTTSIHTCQDAIINAGCPADPNAFAASMKGMMALNQKCRGIRVMACSALTLSWIACGRLTAHFGYDLSSWDLVAGALICQEAGGLVTDIDGSPYKLETRNMLCSNGLVHEQVLNILKEADAVSFERS